ncbi:TIGR03086 family protein [Mycolicibacterium celeriflavum]|uniref:TIGR03086 family metal-binding protein n=1 Tax=Mycolicibacterium celeriflavum TaxID=1249101 RepID=UPI0007FB7D0D|nr:TIGR03086 family metal-binding protein [Mycolicibacterium celeriflavum]OBG12048.1 TIGR03086 family protein [Mycolicibacterium celeriflavum]
MHINDDLRPLHRLAVSASVDIVAGVTRDDLALPTPCAGWDLGDLLTHMTVQHNGFAAAARGSGADLAVWDPATVADAVRADPAGAYAAAAADVLEAFSADGVPDATFALPEFGKDAAVPGSMAIGFHFVDYVVHGWDVARSLGVPFALPAEVIEAVLPLALAVPDGDIRDMDNSPFAHAVTQDEEVASDLDRVLRHLGRSPGWRAQGVTVGR